jgi:hypothetical protein
VKVQLYLVTWLGFACGIIPEWEYIMGVLPPGRRLLVVLSESTASSPVSLTNPGALTCQGWNVLKVLILNTYVHTLHIHSITHTHTPTPPQTCWGYFHWGAVTRHRRRHNREPSRMWGKSEVRVPLVCSVPELSLLLNSSDVKLVFSPMQASDNDCEK